MIVERARPPKGRSAVREPEWVRKSLLAVAILFLGIFVLVPLMTVFEEAFKKGFGVYLASFNDLAALAAIKLTLLVAAIAVPANLVFGVSAAWAISKFDFPGKSLLITLIDLPFAVSPVVAGLIYVLIFGAQGWLGPFLQEHNIKIIFALGKQVGTACLRIKASRLTSPSLTWGSKVGKASRLTRPKVILGQSKPGRLPTW
jgi:sulfate transport system permease protein